MFPVTGRCLCGRVSVTAMTEPIRMAQCHCLDCQKSTGTGHANNALFQAADVEITGDTLTFPVTADSGNVLTRHFCGTCGSRVFQTNTGRPGMVMLPVGIFEDSSWYKPQMVLYTGRRTVWDPPVPGAQAFEAMMPAVQPTAKK